MSLYRPPYLVATEGPIEDLGIKAGEALVAPALVSALQTPAVQAEIERTVQRMLEDEQTRQALRPYLVEAGVAIALGLGVGGLLYRLLKG